MWKANTFIPVFLLGVLGLLGAQSNDRIDELLAQAQARWDTSAYLVMSSVRGVVESVTPDEAFKMAFTAGFVAPGGKPADPVTVEGLAFLVMKAAQLSGGWEWTLLPSPRAAYRELSYHGLVNASGGPDRTVAGDEVIRTLSAAVNFKRGVQ